MTNQNIDVIVYSVDSGNEIKYIEQVTGTVALMMLNSHIVQIQNKSFKVKQSEVKTDGTLIFYAEEVKQSKKDDNYNIADYMFHN
ncbi:hypothetical protein [Bacillus sp. AFS017336]|uniref:hypothetical protein n=1 Tax=Bacillus sp. AFS017336 TaxID=2033489 RepID=UPI000BEFD757|nr:hypothetical protein [Bacillus sp. AFS017336]PEL13779.1 hypothetical protein CN601_03440 [Bacillus sp. AFS017336]